MRRSKLIVMEASVIVALVESDGGPAETLIAAVQIPRVDFQRLFAAAGTLQAGQRQTFYGDGAGAAPGELPLSQPQPPNHDLK